MVREVYGGDVSANWRGFKSGRKESTRIFLEKHCSSAVYEKALAEGVGLQIYYTAIIQRDRLCFVEIVGENCFLW
jgi:hypothetical protein